MPLVQSMARDSLAVPHRLDAADVLRHGRGVHVSQGPGADADVARDQRSGASSASRFARAAELTRDYRGYVWLQWFRKELLQLGTLFAVLLGTGGLFSQRSALFTLSLPASRRRLLGVRATAGLADSWCSCSYPRCSSRCSRPASGRATAWQHAGPRPVPVHRRRRVLQPGGAAVHGVRRRCGVRC